MPKFTCTTTLKASTAFATILLSANTAMSDEITYVSGATGTSIDEFRTIVSPWEEATGHTVTLVPMPSSSTDQFGQYRLWLAAGNTDIDLYQTDVIWAPQLASHFVDMTDIASDLMAQHFPSIVESQTADGALVALPILTDAPALYYRTDLLEKYDVSIPKTWGELTATAQMIQDAEREAGNDDLWGYVWQGASYEGLTCNALEWVKSAGGGQIIEADGTISINNANTIAALEQVTAWAGTISPEGVLAYQEEDARGVWQTGNAVFMRNWSYAYGLGNADDSLVKGLFDVTTLPAGDGEQGVSAATLGGWNVAVSKYGDNQDVAISLAMYLAGPEAQKTRALISANLPTIVSLYDDAEIAAEQPFMPSWKEVFLAAVPRPSAPTGGDYNEASTLFSSAVHSVLMQDSDAMTAMADLEDELIELLED